MMRRAIFVFFLLLSRSFSFTAAAEDGSLKTLYSVVHYPDANTMSEFLWRISGQKVLFPADLRASQNSVDRIIERVQSVLDMYPDAFQVSVRLFSPYTSGDIASYEGSTRSVRVFADRVTDGVFAHEISHAVIDSYFESAPPRKVHEILSRYVDQHLWSDY